MKTLKTITAIALTGLILTTASNAATMKSANDDLQAGSWSLQFSVGESFTLKSFDGSTFSGKYQLSNSSAIRLGISASAKSSELDSDAYRSQSQDSPFGTFSSRPEETSDGKSSQFTIKAKYIKSFQKKGAVRPYVGMGPYVTFSHSNSFSQESVPTWNNYGRRTEDLTLTDREEDLITYGVSLAIGAEVFVCKNISLHAEYSPSYSHSRGDWKRASARFRTRTDSNGTSTQSSSSHYTGEISSNQLTHDSVKLGLSIYL